MRKKRLLLISILMTFLLTGLSALVYAAPPIPARIGGTATVNTVQLTQATDTGYTFKVTKQDGTAYDPIAEDTDGLNASEWFIIDIPIYDATDQPGGAQPDEGEIAVIHVYSGSIELTVTSPANGEVHVDYSGTTNQINIVAESSPDITVTDSVAPIANQEIPFGDVTEGSSSDQTVTVTNDGNADLVIGTIAQNNPLVAPFSIITDNCSGETISPASNCTLTVRFSPTTTGLFNDSFDIPSNDPDESSVIISVNGTGTAVPVPDITVSDAITPIHDNQIPFQDLTNGLSLNKAVRITNDGNADLNILSIAQNNPLVAPFSISNDSCSLQTLAPNKSCTFTVAFSPDSGNSLVDFSDVFDISSNDPDEASVEISVSGKGLIAAHNNTPSTPELVYPASGQQGLGTASTFRWKKCTDPDMNALTYQLYYSTDNNFIGTTPLQVISIFKENSIYYAGTGISFMFFGIVFTGGVRNRKKIMLLLLMALMVVALSTSCGSGGGESSPPTPPTPPTPNTDITQTVSGLSADTTYYWKVVADDGNGGLTESETQSFKTQ